MLLIGSAALQDSISSWRDPKDFDYIADPYEIDAYKSMLSDRFITQTDSKWGISIFAQGSVPIEFEITTRSPLTEELYDIVLSEGLHLRTRCTEFGTEASVLPSVVYTMKMSHRFLKDSKHFKKCMDDIIELRRLGLGQIPECLQDWYKARCKATYDYKHPSLARSKSEFFSDDGVGYIYDHDSIHEAMKQGSRPAYETIKDDSAEVFCSKEKFFSAPLQLQLWTVLEEAYVLALERSQIPYDFKPNAKASFMKALEKICTSISSGWWREFAWENYYQILELYDGNYVEIFKNKLEKGVVKPY